MAVLMPDCWEKTDGLLTVAGDIDYDSALGVAYKTRVGFMDRWWGRSLMSWRYLTRLMIAQCEPNLWLD
jgi:hypothetical protein